jgi:hypothetical protein
MPLKANHLKHPPHAQTDFHPINLNQNKLTMYRSILFTTIWTLLLGTLHGAEGPREQVTRIVSHIQRADYEGDRETLKKCYEELTPFLDNKELASRIRYWRGFDLWRSAINGFNDSVDPKELERLLMQAVDEFKEALARDPAFVDAKVGMLSSLGYVAFIHRKEPESMKPFIAQVTSLVDEVKATAPDNPRFNWVLGPILFYTPVERGGGIDKVMENYQRGLEICAKLKAPKDPLEPSWGKPELLMNVAYMQMTNNPPDLESAERNARAALEIVPYWHYARDIAFPMILAAKEKEKTKAK